MANRRTPGLLALALLAAAAAPAAADELVPPEHAILIGGDFALSLEHYTSSNSSGSLTQIRIAPALDVVVTARLTVGAQLALLHLESGSSSEDAYAVVPRVGWLAALGPSVLIWPRLGLGFEHGSIDINLFGGSSATSLLLVASVPILYTPAPHFYLGLGPALTTQLTTSSSSDNKVTAIGAESLIGGWF